MRNYYYVTANTAEGFINLLPSNINHLQQIISLNHPSQTVKTKILKDIITKYESTCEVEVLKSALGERYLDGVVIREKSIAILNRSIVPNDMSEVTELDLIQYTQDTPVKNAELEEKFIHHTENAYKHLQTGLRIHDDLEEIYIKEMDFKKSRCNCRFVYSKRLTWTTEKKSGWSRVPPLFWHYNRGWSCQCRPPYYRKTFTCFFYIKGRAGTGKSTFMKKVASTCIEYGYDTEIHHCSFDPDSIDMVLVPALDFCMFDSTDPHEFFPTREGEEIIDLYKEAVTPGTDEKFTDEINKVNDHYKSYMKESVIELKKSWRIPGSFGATVFLY